MEWTDYPLLVQTGKADYLEMRKQVFRVRVSDNIESETVKGWLDENKGRLLGVVRRRSVPLAMLDGNRNSTGWRAQAASGGTCCAALVPCASPWESAVFWRSIAWT